MYETVQGARAPTTSGRGGGAAETCESSGPTSPRAGGHHRQVPKAAPAALRQEEVEWSGVYRAGWDIVGYGKHLLLGL